jgi:transposase
MYSVGIDVSKGKSTVSIITRKKKKDSLNKNHMIKVYVTHAKPFDVKHVKSDLINLVKTIKDLKSKVIISMEATGKYHLPILFFLMEHDLEVFVVNPLRMKKFETDELRKVKTDNKDSLKIARYGFEKKNKLIPFQLSDTVYGDLRFLNREYEHYSSLIINEKLHLTSLVDLTMPGITDLLRKTDTNYNGKNKLYSFIERFWHFDLITKKSEKQFINSYNSWAKKNGYHQSEAKAIRIYALAKDGISSLNSNRSCTKRALLESIKILRDLSTSLNNIITQMNELAMSLKEYETVRAMEGVGEILSLRLIAEIGDIKHFKSKQALIAYAGIDVDRKQSGKYDAPNRHISKRGSAALRHVGYIIMMSKKMHKIKGDSVYEYMLKKEQEGKNKKVAKIAGLNKFLRIYYARVSALYA